MKKVGIVVDNYKLEKFKSELTKKGFTDFDVTPFTKGCSTIRVNVPDDQIKEVGKICTLCELHFKRSN
jgi:hypothetical protein